VGAKEYSLSTMDLQTEIYYRVVIPFIQYSVLALGLLAALALVGWLRQRRSDVMAETYEVFMPPAKKADGLNDLVRSWSGVAKPRLGKPVQTIRLDRYKNYTGVHWYLTVAGRTAGPIDQLFYQYGATLEPVEHDPIKETKWDKVFELGLTGNDVPLRIGTPEGVAASFDAALENIPPDHAGCISFVIAPEHARRPTPDDAQKVADHTFNAIIRVGAAGENAERLVKDLLNPFRSIESHKAKFRFRWVREASGRLNRRAATFGFSGLYGVNELVPMMFKLDGLGQHMARRLAPTHEHDSEGIIIGTSNAPKSSQVVAMPVDSGDMHFHAMGPPGTGKSNLLLNLCVQYMMRPDTCTILIEANGDLAHDALHSVPSHRVRDVIYWNPLDEKYAMGLNPLTGGDPERVTNHLVSMLKTISGDTWSATIQRVSIGAIQTAAILQTTVYDAIQYLINPTLRAEALKQLPRSKYPELRQTWDFIESRADLIVDSSVVRIEQLMNSKVMRDILSQREGLSFPWLIANHKILIVALNMAQMKLGASILGSLIREMAWEAAMLQPRDNRQRSVIIMDEFQHFAGEELSKFDAFAEARKFKQQYIIANQYSEQLPRDTRITVDRNVGTKVVFRVAPDEAKNIADRYAPLKPEDLSNLPLHTVAARVMSSGGLAPTVTLKTLPPPPETPYWGQIIDRTNELYAKPRAQVEAEIVERHKRPPEPDLPTFGAME